MEETKPIIDPRQLAGQLRAIGIQVNFWMIRDFHETTRPGVRIAVRRVIGNSVEDWLADSEYDYLWTLFAIVNGPENLEASLADSVPLSWVEGMRQKLELAS